jgi:hypothetical protein
MADHDENANPEALSEAETAKRQEDINQIDLLLRFCRDSGLWRELRHVRRHLTAELAAGSELAKTPDTSTVYDYEIVPRADELSGGWVLRLLEDEKEVGGGTYPLVVDEVAFISWWNALSEAERTLWIKRAPMPSAADAYVTYLLESGWRAASSAAGAWLSTRPQD